VRYYEFWQKPVSAVTKISVGRSSDRAVIVRLWRQTLSSSIVVIATLAGILPASFVFAHFGGELISADAGIVGWAVLGLGLVTGLPLIGIILKRFGEKRSNQEGKNDTE